MINFYADWCRFSNMLAPIWDEAADKAREKFPEPGRVVFAKVDCDKESKKFREIKAQCGKLIIFCHFDFSWLNVVSHKILVAEKVSSFHTEYTQCGNSMIFLPLIIYVKSILGF